MDGVGELSLSRELITVNRGGLGMSAWWRLIFAGFLAGCGWAASLAAEPLTCSRLTQIQDSKGAQSSLEALAVRSVRQCAALRSGADDSACLEALAAYQNAYRDHSPAGDCRMQGLAAGTCLWPWRFRHEAAVAPLVGACAQLAGCPDSAADEVNTALPVAPVEPLARWTAASEEIEAVRERTCDSARAECAAAADRTRHEAPFRNMLRCRELVSTVASHTEEAKVSTSDSQKEAAEASRQDDAETESTAPRADDPNASTANSQPRAAKARPLDHSLIEPEQRSARAQATGAAAAQEIAGEIRRFAPLFDARQQANADQATAGMLAQARALEKSTGELIASSEAESQKLRDEMAARSEVLAERLSEIEKAIRLSTPRPQASTPGTPVPRQIDPTADLIEVFGDPGKSRVKLETSVMLIADPRVPRHRRRYDLALMGLTMGLGDAGYVLDRYGFPWQAYLDDAEKRRNGKDPSGDSRHELFDDGNFGLVVFRRESAGLVEYLAIYLVGEVASVGVPQSSLRRALLYAVRLPPAGGRPLLVGPTFSGSVYSVVTALDGFALDYAHWALVHEDGGYCASRDNVESERLSATELGKYGPEELRRKSRERAQKLGEWLLDLDSIGTGALAGPELCRIKPIGMNAWTHIPEGVCHAPAGEPQTCALFPHHCNAISNLRTQISAMARSDRDVPPLVKALREQTEPKPCHQVDAVCREPGIKMLSYSATAGSNKTFATSFGGQMETLALPDMKKLEWLNAKLSDRPCKPETGACEVAILAEASVFGQGVCGAFNSERERGVRTPEICGSALQVSFPSNISDIRYRRSERRARDGQVISERLPLPRQWDDALALSDGVENGSEFPDSQLSPLTHASVELQLELALQRVQAANPRVVLIAATDVRDRLYLIERMRKMLPRAQMVDLEADVLLGHPRHSHATRGTLMLASAPLRVQGLSNGQAFARAFTSDEQALLYCLARMLPGAKPITREACLRLLKGDESAPEPWIVTRVGSQPVDASDRSNRSCRNLWCGPPRAWTLVLQSLKSGVSIDWALLWATLGLLLAAACVSGALGKLRAALCAMVDRLLGRHRTAEKEQPRLASTGSGLIKPQRSPQTLLSAVWGAIQRSCMDPVISVGDCSGINWVLLQGFPRFLYLIGSALFATYLYTMLPALWPRMDLANEPWEGRILAILVQLLALGTIILTVITGHQFTVIRRLAGTIHMLVLRSTGAAFGTWDRVPPAPIRFGFTVILAHPGPDPGDEIRDVDGLLQRLAQGYVDTLPNRLTLRWMFAQRLTRLRWTLVATAICPLALLAVCWSYPIAARDNVLGFGLLMALACAFFLVYATRSLDRDAVLSPLMINQRQEASETLQGYAVMVAPFVLLALIFLVMESPAIFEGAPGLLAWLWSLLT